MTADSIPILHGRKFAREVTITKGRDVILDPAGLMSIKKKSPDRIVDRTASAMRRQTSYVQQKQFINRPTHEIPY